MPIRHDTANGDFTQFSVRYCQSLTVCLSVPLSWSSLSTMSFTHKLNTLLCLHPSKTENRRWKCEMAVPTQTTNTHPLHFVVHENSIWKSNCFRSKQKVTIFNMLSADKGSTHICFNRAIVFHIPFSHLYRCSNEHLHMPRSHGTRWSIVSVDVALCRYSVEHNPSKRTKMKRKA